MEGAGLAIAESRDGGRTWDVRGMPDGAGFQQVVTANGDDLYAVYVDGRDLTIFASRDRGETWTAGATADATAAHLLATREGGLYVSTPSGVFRSDDHGRTLVRADLDSTHVPAFQATPDGYLAATWHTLGAWVSEDGVTWKKIV